MNSASVVDRERTNAEIRARSELAVHQVQPAPPATAAWLNNIFAPVIEACRFAGAAPGLELRPVGASFAGFASHRAFCPDGRVSVSASRVRLWSRTSLIGVVVHEWAHRLIGTEYGHNAAFAALQQALFIRIDGACPRPPGEEGLGLQWTPLLYDLQDVPDALVTTADGGLLDSWRWAMATARDLAPSELSAEALAAAVAARHAAWNLQLEAAPLAAAARAQAVANAAAAAVATRAKLVAQTKLLRTFGLWLGAAGFAVLAEALMVLRLAFG